MRPTPFGLVFAELARERFPAIAETLQRREVSSADRDHFVLQEPVGRLIEEIMPPEADTGALEAHLRMLHHAYRHWTAGGWVYRIAETVLRRAAAERGPVSSYLPHVALYLQLPELQVWGMPAASAAEPLDGMFVTETHLPGRIAVLGIFGVRAERPGFSAVGVEGRADLDDPSGGELLVAATRDDASPAFSSTLSGGARAGVLSVANAGELLLLTCRLLTLLPVPRETGREKRETDAAVERVVPVE